MTSNRPKERRIVTWTQQEDDILREQISIHGTENWTIIASKFKDKTTRQCRRRWYTYLNSDFKKGGWSPEEDMLLCEAQKIFGNRWTEIAKVVSGRTDNAVKNRFTTLCKKRAKRDALVNENRNTFINANNKRILIHSGTFHAQGMVDIASPIKKLRREHIPNANGNSDILNTLRKESDIRSPFAVLAQNDCKITNSLVTSNKESLVKDDEKTEGTFIRKDDPKAVALMQQAELLSSLGVKVNTRSTDQSLENAWKVLHNFINKSKDDEEVEYDVEGIDLQLGDLKDLLEELRSSNDHIHQIQRKNNEYQSPSSSEFSTGSTILSSAASEYGEQSQSEICTINDDILPCTTIDQEFNSPIQVTPIFRSLASAIPSPQFSESERHFLLRTLGIESQTPNSLSNNIQPPLCRKALLQGL